MDGYAAASTVLPSGRRRRGRVGTTAHVRAAGSSSRLLRRRQAGRQGRPSPTLTALAMCALALIVSAPAAGDKATTLKLTMLRSLTWPTMLPHYERDDLQATQGWASAIQATPADASGLRREDGLDNGCLRDETPPPKSAGKSLKAGHDGGSESTWGLVSPGSVGAANFKPVPRMSPLADSILAVKEQERQHLLQAARCRSALRRMLILERILMSRGQYNTIQSQVPSAVSREVAAWRACGNEISKHMDQTFHCGPALTIAKVLESAATLPADLLPRDEKGEAESGLNETKSTRTRLYRKLSPSPSRQDLLSDAAKREWGMDLEARLARRRWQHPYKSASRVASNADIPVGDSPLPPHLEERFRIGTWNSIPVYGVCQTADGNYEYADGTELHLIFDVDGTKLVGEGTNDVELVLKCMLWWKEELEHDANFIPKEINTCVRAEFTDFCKNYNMSAALDRLMPYISRPHLKSFVDRYSDAKWWTFTNKDRIVDGDIMREVSDEDGLCGMYQDEVHEVSGRCVHHAPAPAPAPVRSRARTHTCTDMCEYRPVIDANKMALRLLEERVDVYAGMKNQERPLVGVRGEQKDLTRVARLLKCKLDKGRQEPRPITLCLLDDKAKDGWGKCQVNDQRCLAVVPAYTAISEQDAETFSAIMEEILPLDTLGRFYRCVP